MCPSVLKNVMRLSLKSVSEPDCFGIPSMPATCPVATCTPTPVRKPTSTVRERKLARKPRRAIRARKSMPPASSAERLARPTHCGDAGLEPRDPERDDARVHDRGGRRVGADHEMSRRAEQREGRDRDQDRVQAGDHRHAGDLRVAHHLGDRERRQRDPGDDVLREPGPLVRQDPLEDRDVPAQPRMRRCGRAHRGLAH